MNVTSIEWTTFSANPLKYRDAEGRTVWACVHASPGCQHCYAETLAKRYDRGGPFNVPTTRAVTPFLDEKEMRTLLTAKKIAGAKVFLNDMTDLFGEWVPDSLIDRMFAVMALRPDVTWQILTKRAKRMRAYLSHADRPTLIARQIAGLPLKHRHTWESARAVVFGIKLDENPPRSRWPLPNVWLGVSAEDQQRADERIPLLLETPAAVRFVSAEPLLGPIDLRRWLFAEHGRRHIGAEPGVSWVIVGGESGPKARPCNVAWVRSIVRQCKAAKVACFVKQLGSHVRDRNCAGFDADSHTWADGPDAGTPVEPTAWPDRIAEEDRVEHNPDGYREEYQGAPVRIHLSKKGGDPSDWPVDLRVRDLPTIGGHG